MPCYMGTAELAGRNKALRKYHSHLFMTQGACKLSPAACCRQKSWLFNFGSLNPGTECVEILPEGHASAGSPTEACNIAAYRKRFLLPSHRRAGAARELRILLIWHCRTRRPHRRSPHTSVFIKSMSKELASLHQQQEIGSTQGCLTSVAYLWQTGTRL